MTSTESIIPSNPIQTSWGLGTGNMTTIDDEEEEYSFEALQKDLEESNEVSANWSFGIGNAPAMDESWNFFHCKVQDGESQEQVQPLPDHRTEEEKGDAGEGDDNCKATNCDDAVSITTAKVTDSSFIIEEGKVTIQDASLDDGSEQPRKSFDESLSSSLSQIVMHEQGDEGSLPDNDDDDLQLNFSWWTLSGDTVSTTSITVIDSCDSSIIEGGLPDIDDDDEDLQLNFSWWTLSPTSEANQSIKSPKSKKKKKKVQSISSISIPSIDKESTPRSKSRKGRKKRKSINKSSKKKEGSKKGHPSKSKSVSSRRTPD